MKKAFLSILILFSLTLSAQEFVDKEYYLIDSLVLEDLPKRYQLLIDTSISNYYGANEDTSQMFWIENIVIACWEESVWTKYNSLITDRCNNFLAHSNMLSAKEIRYYQSRLARAINNEAWLLNQHGKVIEALNKYLFSLQLKEKIGDSLAIANGVNNVGYIYEKQEEFDKMLECYYRSLKICETIKDTSCITLALNNLGFYYRSIGENKKSIPIFLKNYMLQKETNDFIGLAYTCNGIGGNLMDNGMVDSSIIYFNEALVLAKEYDVKEIWSFSYLFLGKSHFQKGELKTALAYSDSALAIAEKHNIIKCISRAAKLSYQVLKTQKKWKMSMEVYELHIQMRDSIKNEKTQKATIRQQTKYEFEKQQLLKEQDIKEATRVKEEKANRRNNIQYSGIFVFVLILFASVFMFGKFSISSKAAEGLIFFTFLLFFEFCLVLLDPYIDKYSGGEPAYKLLFNAILAGAIFPLHAFFENTLKKRLLN